MGAGSVFLKQFAVNYLYVVIFCVVSFNVCIFLIKNVKLTLSFRALLMSDMRLLGDITIKNETKGVFVFHQAGFTESKKRRGYVGVFFSDIPSYLLLLSCFSSI